MMGQPEQDKTIHEQVYRLSVEMSNPDYARIFPGSLLPERRRKAPFSGMLQNPLYYMPLSFNIAKSDGLEPGSAVGNP